MPTYLKIPLVGIVFIITVLLLIPVMASADSFSVAKEQKIHLFSEALDLAVSIDGRFTFVLTKNGMVSIYNSSGELVQSLKAGKGFNSLEYSAAGNRLLLSGPERKEVKILSLSTIYDLDYKGSPFKGSPDAPVTIAVFDDFQ